MLKAIKKMASRLVPARSDSNLTPVEMTSIPGSDHRIAREDISDNALKVIQRLRKMNHQAYLVGGAVRDLLLEGHPKDFDIATDATPEQVRDIFRNSRVIGRRFKIVHVLFGREIIEVTTFRGHAGDQPPNKKHKQSDTGMLVRDNVYGTLEEDAERRDFTVNALYYDAEDCSVLDFCGGMDDLEARCIRVIGNPEQRYREDPVRMLRAIRFAAKLDFDLHEATAEPIFKLSTLLNDIPAARMFDEVLKLLMSGYGEHVLPLLEEFGVLQCLFPDAHASVKNNPVARRFIELALLSTDDRIHAGKPVTPAFIFAALLWYPTVDRSKALMANNMPPLPALSGAAQQILEQQQQHTSIPRRFTQPIREIWEMQPKLEQRRAKQVELLLENKRFRAAYDFLLLREQAGEALNEVGSWWTEIQDCDASRRAEMIESVQKSAPNLAKSRRRRTTTRRKSVP